MGRIGAIFLASIWPINGLKSRNIRRGGASHVSPFAPAGKGAPPPRSRNRSTLCAWLVLIAGVLGAPAALSQIAARDPDPLHGKRLFLMCAACHTLHDGEADKVGPNLYGVVGKAAASRGAFAYSDALRHSGIIWSTETLNVWLKQPSALVPGCKMAFPGLPNDQDRTDVIAFLTEATR